MASTDSLLSIAVVWRGNKYIVEMNPDASVKNLGDELQKLTDVKPDTMRLIVPEVSKKGSKLLSPFSNEHSQLSLQKASVIEVTIIVTDTLTAFKFDLYYIWGMKEMALEYDDHLFKFRYGTEISFRTVLNNKNV